MTLGHKQEQKPKSYKHNFGGALILRYLPYCKNCGLLALQNKQTRKLLQKSCNSRWED